MAYEDPPAICYTLPPGHCRMHLTFVPDMNPELFPPDDRWITTCPNSVLTLLWQEWTANHFLDLMFLCSVFPPIDPITLEYGPIHPGLQTHFATVYPAWTAIVVPPCP